MTVVMVGRKSSSRSSRMTEGAECAYSVPSGVVSALRGALAIPSGMSAVVDWRRLITRFFRFLCREPEVPKWW